MRKNRSPYASSRYPNLYAYPAKTAWVFRKYSAEKKDEFICSTGLEKTPRNEAAAYKIGLERFNEWLGVSLPSDRQVLIRDLARAVLAAKEATAENTYRSAKSQIEKHILPAFGHLRPEQVTRLRWQEYEAQERKRPTLKKMRDGTTRELGPRTKLYNTHKYLMEILRMAFDSRLIDRVPALPLGDAAAEGPRVIPKETVLKIIRAARGTPPYMKLWAFIMWKQGARPSEILRYRFSMIRWEEGTHGMLEIPAEITKTRRKRKVPLNRKVARILRWLHERRESDWIFAQVGNPAEPIRDYGSGWEGVMRRLGLDYDPYNLRDTFITDALKRGLSSVFIGKYCDNSGSMIERRYAVPEQSIMERVAN